MKKVLLLLTIMLITISFIHLEEKTLYAANAFIEDNKTLFESNEKLSISKFSYDKTPKQISNEIGEQILFEYDIPDTSKRNTISLKEIAKLYYYKDDVFYMDSLNTYSSELNEIENEIIDFYQEKMKFINSSTDNTETRTNTELFTYVTGGSTRIVSKPYGYMDHFYTVSKYRANNISSLYIVETNSTFVPGHVAYENGDETYNKNMYLYEGFIHLNATRAKEELDQETIRYGGTPYFKDGWPVNEPGKLTINSSFNVGLSLGYSFINGFSLKDLYAQNEQHYGTEISFGYSKSYLQDEPSFYSLNGSTNQNQYQWHFEYGQRKNGDEPYHLNTGYMFEMNNSGHDLIGEGQFGLVYNFQMTVSKKILVVYDLQTPFTGVLYVNWW